jgi:hypothetical protein
MEASHDQPVILPSFLAPGSAAGNASIYSASKNFDGVIRTEKRANMFAASGIL